MIENNALRQGYCQGNVCYSVIYIHFLFVDGHLFGQTYYSQRAPESLATSRTGGSERSSAHAATAFCVRGGCGDPGQTGPENRLDEALRCGSGAEGTGAEL